MCNVKSNLKKHCNAVHQMDYPTPDVKRIKIVPQIKGISDTVATSDDPVNSGTVAVDNAAVNSGADAVNNAAVKSNAVSSESTAGNLNVVTIGSTAGDSDTAVNGNTADKSCTVAIGCVSGNSGTVAINVTAGNSGVIYLSKNPCSVPDSTSTVNSHTVAPGNIAWNGCREATNTYETMDKQRHFLVESQVLNSVGVPVAGCVLDQERVVSNSHASNACLAAEQNNPGNFLFLLNGRGTSDIRHTTARRDLSLQQNLVTFVEEEVNELRFEQV